ncbi:Late competence development protein ComFB [[Leptolyngbya] sp. PCC 7376]|uniref:late competence development ComFB family protein n=1 Tax=[Leptolyngbya] sp. PCC 7376 TaxID=111781 RepID=UPI00029ED1AE|nr:late competence development ComFB family protein [[Leptolyngbya] sp. PCC 7376]AFY40414.1 Late competence development protein ComFB [[Leptolyngbya] sp. PCC 7376]
MGQPKKSSPGKGNLRAYQNIMETLVHQEIHRQLKAMPAKLVKYIDISEVATFALNRLPPLYASSEQGKERQAAKGQLKLKQEVATSVRQALAAVQRDPLRNSTPLPPDRDPRYQTAESTLVQLEELLRRAHLLDPETPTLSWDNLQLVIAKALKRTAERGIVDRRIEQILSENDYGRYTSSVHDWTDHQYH